LINKDKIFEPLLYKIAESYRFQRDSYYKIAALTKQQSQIKDQKEISLFTEIASEKDKLFEEIAERNEYLKKAKEDILKALKIEEFTISALKENLNTPATNDLLNALVETGEAIKELENSEKENEDNLKRILKLS
jgi:hypothetical protein